MTDWAMWTAYGTWVSGIILAVTITITFLMFTHENRRVIRIVISWIERDYVQIRFENNGNKNLRLDAFGMYYNGKSIRLDSKRFVFKISNESIRMDEPTTIQIRRTFFEKWVGEELEEANSIISERFFPRKHDRVRFYVTGSGLNFYSSNWMKERELIFEDCSLPQESTYLHTERWKRGPFEKCKNYTLGTLMGTWLCAFISVVLRADADIFFIIFFFGVFAAFSVFTYYRAKAGIIGIGKIFTFWAPSGPPVIVLYYIIAPTQMGVFVLLIVVTSFFCIASSLSQAGYASYSGPVYHDVDVNAPY